MKSSKIDPASPAAAAVKADADLFAATPIRVEESTRSELAFDLRGGAEATEAVNVIKQIAGDLLPKAGFEDRIASAFHRQTAANDEGGTDNEEFRLLAVMDRVSTTWSVLNGVSMNCV